MTHFGKPWPRDTENNIKKNYRIFSISKNKNIIETEFKYLESMKTG